MVFLFAENEEQFQASYETRTIPHLYYEMVKGQ